MSPFSKKHVVVMPLLDVKHENLSNISCLYDGNLGAINK